MSDRDTTSRRLQGLARNVRTPTGATREIGAT